MDFNLLSLIYFDTSYLNQISFIFRYKLQLITKQLLILNCCLLTYITRYKRNNTPTLKPPSPYLLKLLKRKLLSFLQHSPLPQTSISTQSIKKMNPLSLWLTHFKITILFKQRFSYEFKLTLSWFKL